MDKRTDALYVRMPDHLKRQLARHAKRNLRSLNETIILLVSLGLHVEQFNAAKYLTEDRDVEHS